MAERPKKPQKAKRKPAAARRSASTRPRDPDLRAAAQHLRRALAALGDGDPAARMTRSALGNIERRLAGARAPEPPGPLELRRGKGDRWQLWSGRRVLRAARLPNYEAAQLWAMFQAAELGRTVVDKTTAEDRGGGLSFV